MIGKSIHDFAKELWGLNRSLTGEGNRLTLKKITEHLPELEVHGVPSGTNVFDWTVPNEWKVNDAFILTPSGEKICHFKENNLYLVGYSRPVNAKISLQDLKKRLHSIPEQAGAVPYITSYYGDYWGFCISQDQLNLLEDGIYHVVIDTELFLGEMNYGELVLPGTSTDEVLLSTYICHPSMANNELSGPVTLTFLAKWLQTFEKLKKTYRFVFVPETIGSVAYIARNLENLKDNTIAGFNVSCVGDNRAYSYIPSRNGDTLADEIAKHVLFWTDDKYIKYSWLDRGSDERQYCSPGVDLPMATICRSKFGEYPEYHTSLDDLDNVVTADGLQGSYDLLQKMLTAIEGNNYYKCNTICEPQMSKRNLYPEISTKDTRITVAFMMDIISYCDGTYSLLEIAEILSVPIWSLYPLIDTLLEKKVISQL